MGSRPYSLLKIKHQVAMQGTVNFEKRSKLGICENFRSARNAAWRPSEPSFNSLPKGGQSPCAENLPETVQRGTLKWISITG